MFFLTLLAAWLLGASPAWAASASGDAARAYVLYRDGELIEARSPDRRLPMASLTKIMTGLLVLENSGLDDLVTVSPEAAAEHGSRLGLRQGERLTVIELLAGALLPSANDACHALAVHVAGSQAAFVELMNRRAAELGLNSTRFANACGHDRPGHYATARDLARLTEAALANPVFAKMVGLVRGSIRTEDGKRSWTLENSNAIIGRYQGAAGVKTGFTANAGKCLVAAAERNGSRVLLVLLNAPDRWWQAEALLDRAFGSVQAAPAAPRTEGMAGMTGGRP